MNPRQPCLINLLPLIAVFALGAIAAAGAPGISSAQEQTVIAGNHADEAGELTGGEIPGDRALRLEISMSLRNRDQLEKLIAQQQDPASPLYNRWLTPAEFNDRFGPAAEDVAKVEAWLASSGFSL